MSTADSLFQSWLSLSESERQEFQRRLQQATASQPPRSVRNDSFDLGPISQGHCPHCGR